MTKQEQLQKAVVDADAAWDDATDAAVAHAAIDAWLKAKRELAEYLKEQDK